MGYRYYITNPVIKDNYPEPKNNSIEEICGFREERYVDEIESKARGYIEYSKPLGHFDVIDFKLVAVKTKTLHLKYLGEDEWGRYVYEDENGILWKKTDCCSPRECCEERGDVLNTAAGNNFDGEPDCFMGDHIQVIYVSDEQEPVRHYTLIQNLVEMIRATGGYLYNKEFADVLEKGSGITLEELVSYDIFDESILEGGEEE